MEMKWKVAAISAVLFACGMLSTGAASAAPPTGGCSMLTPAQIEKVLGQPFGAPAETKAPPAYAGQSSGSNCGYSSQNGAHITVTFIVYVDASPTEAKQTFDKLSAWYMPKSKPGIGNSAYIDAHGAIHVLKGKVRYFISISPDNEKQTIDLATAIAGRI